MSKFDIMSRYKRYRRSNPGSREGKSDNFDHRDVYGASFATLEALCFREWPSIDSVGDKPPGERKSAMFAFATSHDFETVDMGAGEIVIPIKIE